MQRFEQRIALVTGAASGIGLATTRRLAAEGATVYACDLHTFALAATDPSERIIVEQMNVASSDEVNAVFDRVRREHGRIDALVNAAGVADSRRRSKVAQASGRFEPSDLTDVTDDDFQEVLDINLSGPFHVMRAAVPLLRANGPRGGAVVNLSSVAALMIFPLPVPYPTAKAGVLGLTRAAAAALAPWNIRVNAVAPGSTDTPMLPTEDSMRELLTNLAPLRRIASADEMAATIVYLLSDEAAFITGQTISSNGGVVG